VTASGASPTISAATVESGFVVSSEGTARASANGAGQPPTWLPARWPTQRSAGARQTRRTTMHADNGVQYTSVWRSVWTAASSADNALGESLEVTFKRETLQGRRSWPNERSPISRLPRASSL
jgi:transposase InsO family protein